MWAQEVACIDTAAHSIPELFFLAPDVFGKLLDCGVALRDRVGFKEGDRFKGILLPKGVWC